MVRQRGVNTLVNELYNNKGENKAQANNCRPLVKIFESQISRFIKELLADPVEKIREKSILLIQNYLLLVAQ